MWQGGWVGGISARGFFANEVETEQIVDAGMSRWEKGDRALPGSMLAQVVYLNPWHPDCANLELQYFAAQLLAPSVYHTMLLFHLRCRC